MEMIILLAVLSLVLGTLPRPSALPMTDYSQLNHDEPTHWTKAATTHAPSTSSQWNTKKQTSATFEPSGAKPSAATSPQQLDSTANDNNTKESQLITLSLQDQSELTTRSFFSTNDPLSIYPNENETTTDTDFGFDRFNYSSTDKNASKTELNLAKSVTKLEQDVTSESTTEPTTSTSENYDENDEKSTNLDHYYRYDLVEDLRKLFTNDNDMGEKQDLTDADLDKALNSFKKPDDTDSMDDSKNQIMHKFDYNNQDGFESDQEEEEMRKDDVKPKSVYDVLAMPTLSEIDESYDADTPFKKWDRDSEEQEKLLENIVFQANNDTFDQMEIGKTESSSDEQTGGGRWFLLLLAGNSTIVRLRQKDFAKYLKLNLAARLSLEYDEVKLNKVVLAPPRLMVNVSVVPSGMGNLDEEFDLNERLFGEEEAPLHKLAETNATLLELSGEEYHVVRFLSLRSQQPLALDEVASETSVVVSDHHGDIERAVYIWIGTICIFLLIPLIVALCRLYLLPMKIKWPWKRDKPLFTAPWALPRHQRMEEPPAPIGGPLKVIYSGAFVDRNGPPSGSWIEDNYQSSSILHDEPNLENPVYGFGALDKSTVREICDPSVLESPRFNIDSKLRILGCRPNHLLIPHTPIKRADQKSNLDVRIPKGLDNPNYQT
ncbi:uncharacterized protein LOC106667697 [Cimex lectularius]|uniref:Uncharacterized protein n=1 Tax=Cimex lectularius TaxID=79782 RepID=A0A8I6STT5_CIMLE|nr:uncharacterized protein LOC106667697 [Cimex lectularius]XP_024086436.1 uncharacterized protein LOC106667697 [Cimex lectularius]